MTKKEVAHVIAYCEENKISYKQRLRELIFLAIEAIEIALAEIKKRDLIYR